VRMTRYGCALTIRDPQTAPAWFFCWPITFRAKEEEEEEEEISAASSWHGHRAEKIILM